METERQSFQILVVAAVEMVAEIGAAGETDQQLGTGNLATG